VRFRAPDSSGPIDTDRTRRIWDWFGEHDRTFAEDR
jgi:hypothetical protein